MTRTAGGHAGEHSSPATSSKSVATVGAVFLGLVSVAILLGERRRPLRIPRLSAGTRTATNVAMGLSSMAAMALAERPLTRALSRAALGKRRGIVQVLPLSPLARDLLALVLSDYAMYLWHVATHRVPLLWRFHLVHHIDLDLDSSTALRFHAVDMVISAPVRAAQVVLIGVSPRALILWQNWFFASVLFHHSNVRLPLDLERVLARILTTPRMHGIHHTAKHDRTDSNWSSGLALWDHLHGTFRLEVPQESDEIGVPAYRMPSDLDLKHGLSMPFLPQRDAWRETRQLPSG